MNNNFGWHQQQVDERIQSAFHDAAKHRLANRKPQTRPTSRFPFKRMLVLAIGGFLIGLLLSGCVSEKTAFAGEPQFEAANQPAKSISITMAERIRFQDRLWEQVMSQEKHKSDLLQPGWTMADRIRFQDHLWEKALADGKFTNKQGENAVLTMADRIRFQDKLENYP
jgi:hypothetical protein